MTHDGFCCKRPFGTFALVGLFALAFGLFGGACATTDDGRALNYSLTAKQNYDKGLAELKDENYAEAQKYFTFVKQKFPFSKYAALAELALADTLFERESHQEAIDAYKTFARLHPTHEKVEEGYIGFKVAECYVKEMPQDWFLIPPAAEKDQSSVRDAYRELTDFLEKYGDSKFVEQAKRLRREVTQRLMEHEVYVARFYLAQERPRSAALRLETALRKFPESGREAELLLVLGQTELQMGNPVRARRAFERVAAEFGSDTQARRARVYLEFILNRYGTNPQDKNPHG